MDHAEYVITPTSVPGTLDDIPYNVHSTDGTYLGRIAQIGGKWIANRYGHGGVATSIYWKVLTAGPRVPVDLTTRYATQTEAAEEVVRARRNDTLHVRGDDGLTDFEKDLLDFEDKFTFVNPGDGAKRQAISDLLGINETRYYQMLATLLTEHHMAARAYVPLAVKRLERRMESRRRRRTAARTGGA
jgi:hypothetical protein